MLGLNFMITSSDICSSGILLFWGGRWEQGEFIILITVNSLQKMLLYMTSAHMLS